MNNQKQENLKQLFKETFLQVTTDSESFIQFLNQIKLLHKYDLASQLGQSFPQEEELKEKVAEQTRINTEIECSLSKKTDRHSTDEEIMEDEEMNYSTEESSEEEIEMGM